MNTMLPAEVGLVWYGIRKAADDSPESYSLKVVHHADGPCWIVEAR